MNNDYAILALQIVNALNLIPGEQLQDSRPVWTSRIKQLLRDIGIKERFNVCPSPVAGDECQWLYDLIWYRNNDQNRLHEVALVMESEWSLHPEDIRMDFEKLLVANSPLKVMVFQNNEDKIDVGIEKLRQGIDDYKFPVSCIYILACYKTDGSRVKIRAFKKEPGLDAELMPALSRSPV